MTTEQALLAGIAAQAATIGVLWGIIRAGNKKQDLNYEKLQARTEECEKDRLKLWQQIATIKAENRHL